MFILIPFITVPFGLLYLIIKSIRSKEEKEEDEILNSYLDSQF